MTLTQAQAEAARWARQAPEPATPAEALELILEGRRDEAAYRLLRHVRAEAARADHASDFDAAAWEAAQDRQSRQQMDTIRLCLGIEVAA